MNSSILSVATLRALRRQLRRLCRLEGRDWLTVASTLGTALVVEVGLRTMRLPSLAHRLRVPLSQEQAGASPGSDGVDFPSDIVRRLKITARVMQYWPFDEKCLRHSLVCGWTIRAFEPRLVVGVALVNDEVKAHAWLTVGGVSLDPSGSASFLGLAPIAPQ
jgi:Transglutaminase-like superfamily